MEPSRRATSAARQAAGLSDLLSGDRLITIEPPHERLYFFAGEHRVHRSKLLSWWRRGWIEIEGEDVSLVDAGPLGQSRKRIWALTDSGAEAVRAVPLGGEGV